MTAPDPDGPDLTDDDATDGPADDDAIGPADDGMAPIVNNTGQDADAGDDADAASG